MLNTLEFLTWLVVTSALFGWLLLSIVGCIVEFILTVRARKDGAL